MSTWISVKDKEPEIGRHFIVTIKHKLSGEVFSWMLMYMGGHEWDNDEWMLNNYEVTHWQPLPEPPKE